MADIDKLKRILRKDVAYGKSVTDTQLTEVAKKVSELQTIDESSLRKIAAQVVKDPDTFICASTDMGEIKNELGKDKK